jgi:hypothetical protein
MLGEHAVNNFAGGEEVERERGRVKRDFEESRVYRSHTVH